MSCITSNLFEFVRTGLAILCVQSYLVAETLGSNDGNLIANSLVCLKIEGQLWVVSLDDDLGGLLNGLGTNATHDCGVGVSLEVWSLKSSLGKSKFAIVILEFPKLWPGSLVRWVFCT